MKQFLLFTLALTLFATTRIHAQNPWRPSGFSYGPVAGYDYSFKTPFAGATLEYQLPFGQRWSFSPNITAVAGYSGKYRDSAGERYRVLDVVAIAPVSVYLGRVSLRLGFGYGQQHASGDQRFIVNDRFMWRREGAYFLFQAGAAVRLGSKDKKGSEIFIQNMGVLSGKIQLGIRF